MSMTIEEIEKEISALRAEEKAVLLRHLINELDGPADNDVDKSWQAEAQRRHNELIQGKVETIPSDEVFKTARERVNNAGKISS